MVDGVISQNKSFNQDNARGGFHEHKESSYRTRWEAARMQGELLTNSIQNSKPLDTKPPSCLSDLSDPVYHHKQEDREQKNRQRG